MNLIQITEPGARNVSDKQADGVAIGIDLGTTNSLASVIKDGAPVIIDKVASVVRYNKNEILVGNNSSNDDITFSSIKRLMGKSQSEMTSFRSIEKYNFEDSKDGSISFKVNGKTLTPVEISSEILKYLKSKSEAFLQREVSKAVITVPAYFDDAARNATKLAANLAGLDVLRLINEPTAAALAYGIDDTCEGKYIIYDLGGGTFDLSLLNMQKGVFQVLATSGDANFGGDDIDSKLLEFLLTQIQSDQKLTPNLLSSLFGQARKIKEDLSFNDKINSALEIGTLVREITVTKEQFNLLIDPAIDYTISLLSQLITDSSLEQSEIKGIVLVGGATRIPLIKQKLSKKFSITIYDNLNPDTIVAEGAAIQAHTLTKGSDQLLLDVVPLSLGIEIMGGIFDRIINKNSPIPMIKEEEFTTYEDGQTGITIHVLQGERELAKDCRSLAKFTVANLPAMKAGALRIIVNFSIDADGILTVTAYEKNSHEKQIIEVKPSYGMDLEKIQAMLKSAHKNAADDINAKKLMELITNAYKMLSQLEMQLKEDRHLISTKELKKIDTQITILQEAISKKNADKIDCEIKKLDKLSENFVNLRINFYLNKTLKGKSVNEVEQKFLS